MIRTDPVVRKANGYRKVREDAAKSAVVPTRESRSEEQLLNIVYEAKDGSLFTPERLRAIHNFESVIFRDYDGEKQGEKVKFSDFCQIEPGASPPKCVEPFSVLNVFTAPTPNATRPFAGKDGAACELDCLVDNPDARLATVVKDQALWESAMGSFGKDFTADSPSSRWGMSSYSLGLPIEGYSNPAVEVEEQRKKGDKLLVAISEEWREVMGMEWEGFAQMFRSPYQKAANLLTKDGKDVGVKVRWWSLALQRDEWQSMSFTDLNWVLFCVICVGLYTYIHTRSALLTVVCILQIIMSIFVALFFFRLVFQVTFFSFVNFLIIFVVLGVGADDVFVFTDTFAQSEFHLEGEGVRNPDLEDRLVFTVKRASKAIWVTSFTTSAAFLATAASPLLPLQSFGIYSALVVLSLFCINCMVVPPALVLYSRNFQNRSMSEACGNAWCGVCIAVCGIAGLNPRPTAAKEKPRLLKTEAPGPAFRCLCPPCAVLDVDGPGTSAIAATAAGPLGGLYANFVWKPDLEGAAATNAELAGAEKPAEQTMTRDQEEGEKEAPKLRAIERFFMGPFFKLLAGPMKYVSLAVFAALFVVGIVGWSKLDVPRDPEQWFPNNHMFQQYSNIGQAKEFHTSGAQDSSGNALRVSAVWGIKDVDTSGTDQWDPTDLGRVVYDSSFSLATGEAQKHVFAVAAAVKKAPCTLPMCVGDKLATDDAEGVKNVLGDRDASGSLVHGFYAWTTWTNATEMCTANERCSSFSPENPLTGDTFLHKLCEYNARKDVQGRYPGLLVFDLDATSGKCPPVTSPPPKMRVLALRIVTTVSHPQPPQTFVDLRKEWNAFASKQNDGAPGGAKGMYITSTDIFWMWSVTTNALTSGMYLGMSICFPLVFVVLALATGNVILALYATTTILGIISSVLGMGVHFMMGWPLGTAEAVAAVIVIGLSVDYCVHLANAFIESNQEKKEDRMKDALAHMGISVTAGAFTTISSAVWLFACILLFFNKFAFLMVWTILMSYVWAVLFFPALVLVAFPGGGIGDLEPAYRAVKRAMGLGGADASSEPAPSKTSV